VAADKQALRQRMRDLIGAIPPEEAATRSRAICDRLATAPELAVARSILLTLALPGEPDLAALGEILLDRGHAICLPRIDWKTRSMTPVRVSSLTEGLVSQRHGVQEPGAGMPLDPRDLDCVLVPGMAFDAAGGRLGRGGGFFDRMLETGGLRAWVCGVGFDCQVVDRVPTEAHDARMDAVATEDRLVICRKPRR
jgi:5-formyltetrahydrofolate cyclo-ligase